ARAAGSRQARRSTPGSPAPPRSNRRRRPWPTTTTTAGSSAGITAATRKRSRSVKKESVASRSAHGSTTSADWISGAPFAGIRLLAEGFDEFLQQERVVALDRAGQEVLGGGRELAVPDLEERLLRGLEEAVGFLVGTALRDRALLLGEGDRPLLRLPDREVERAGLLHVGLVEALRQPLEDLLDLGHGRP